MRLRIFGYSLASRSRPDCASVTPLRSETTIQHSVRLSSGFRIDRGQTMVSIVSLFKVISFSPFHYFTITGFLLNDLWIYRDKPSGLYTDRSEFRWNPWIPSIGYLSGHHITNSTSLHSRAPAVSLVSPQAPPFVPAFTAREPSYLTALIFFFLCIRRMERDGSESCVNKNKPLHGYTLLCQSIIERLFIRTDLSKLSSWRDNTDLFSIQ